MYLQPLQLYYNSKKTNSKTKKNQYLKNGGFYQKSSQNKKDVKSNFPSDKVIKFCVSSANSVFDGGLAAILNLTSRPPEGPQNFPHLKNGNSISIPINMQKLKECLFKGTIGPFFDTFAVAYRLKNEKDKYEQIVRVKITR